MKECHLTLINEQTKEEIKVDASFEDEDWQRLELFVQYADDLFQTSLVKQGVPASFGFKWQEDQGFTLRSKLPPADDIIVFLHKCRPIILEKETTSFPNISSLLSRRLSHPYFRLRFKDLTRIYHSTKQQSMYTIRVNDVVVNTEKVLFAWLNAYEYHRIASKQKEIKDFVDFFSIDHFKAICILLLAEKVKAIYGLRELACLVLGKERRISMKIDEPPAHSPHSAAKIRPNNSLGRAVQAGE